MSYRVVGTEFQYPAAVCDYQVIFPLGDMGVRTEPVPPTLPQTAFDAA